MHGVIRMAYGSPGLRSRTNPDPVMEVSFTDRDPMQVIAFLELTLAVFRDRLEAKKDKPVPPIEDDEEDLD